MITHLVWLRNDLRINDNLALHAACTQPDARVIALFIATPGQWQQHEMAARQVAFIHQSLDMLQSSLAERAFRFIFISVMISRPASIFWSAFARSSRSISFSTITSTKSMSVNGMPAQKNACMRRT